MRVKKIPMRTFERAVHKNFDGSKEEPGEWYILKKAIMMGRIAGLVAWLLKMSGLYGLTKSLGSYREMMDRMISSYMKCDKALFGI